MTPEERWTRIENAIEALIETQARHEAQLEKHSAQLEKQSAQIRQHTEQIDKQNTGIRDLIAVSRTLIEAQQGANKQISALAEAQKRTDDRLNALMKTVDRLLKNFQRSNGNR